MLLWLIGVSVFVLLWYRLWRANLSAGFGVLVGLPLAWFFSRLLTPYVTGMNEIPVWLPPLPLAIVAVTLFVFGVIIWFRADNLPPPRHRDTHDAHGPEHGHDSHSQH